MTLATSVRVRPTYARSINLERDLDRDAVVSAYIPTTRAVETLRRVYDGLGSDDQPRAWSLVGPYGAGKSAFGLFLAKLLADPSNPALARPIRHLRSIDPELCRELTQRQSNACVAILTGGPEPLTRRLLNALHTAAQSFWRNRPGRRPSILREIGAAAQGSAVHSQVVNLVDGLQSAIERAGGGPLIIVIDELGKFLEYEARHYGADETFLLQRLAEHAQTGRDCNLLLLALLHQSFDQYARGLSDRLKDDWAKVQGRFENISFIEGQEQSIRLVAEALDVGLDARTQQKVGARCCAIAQALQANNALPGALDAEQAAKLFARCYPLHPVTLLTLPGLCHKVAQNERTLFSFLASREPHSFNDVISQLSDRQEWVTPDVLFDYFVANQPAAVSDPFTQRRWAEVVTGVERASDVSADAVTLTKTIGILNLVGGQRGIGASDQILKLIEEDARTNPDTLDALLERSIVQFRRFSSEYRIWQGTDLDVEATIQREVDRLGKLDLTDVLARRADVTPIVARKHSIETGAIRSFEPVFVDVRSYRQLEEDGNCRLLMFLAEGQDDELAFEEIVKCHRVATDILGLCSYGSQLRSALTEAIAIEAAISGVQALAEDPVAMRELKDRLHAARRHESELISDLLHKPETSQWYWHGKQLNVPTRREFQRQLSVILDKVFDAAPRIRNELINRDSPSSQANAARNKLLEGLIEHRNVPDLGIEGFPPEKAIYRSIFQQGGIHREREGRLDVAPPPTEDPLRILPAWQEIERFFESTEQNPQTVLDLRDRLHRPPYGVKHGVFELLFIPVLLCHEHEVALFEEGAYVPSLGVEHVERFCRQPQTFTFQRFRIEGLRADIFRSYGEALFNDSTQRLDVLGIARPLTHFMLGLTEYARNTKALTDTTLRVRQAFVLSKSPERLLLEDIPKACCPDGDHARLAERFLEVLRELKSAYPKLIQDFQGRLAAAFGVSSPTLSELRAVLRGRCDGLDRYSVDRDGVRAFIRRIVSTTDDDDEQWLNGVLLFLGRKPAAKWTDQDRDLAEYRLSTLARSIRDLERLRLHEESESHRTRGSDLDIYLIKTLRKGKQDEQDEQEFEEVVSLTPQSDAAIKAAQQEIEAALGRIDDPELKLATIARVADDYLRTYRKARPEAPTSDTGARSVE